MQNNNDKVILGISYYFHDSAASLIRNGEIVAAAQEERFTRIKHDPAFPKNAISYCLAEAKLNVADIHKIVFYEDPALKFKRILKTYASFFPQSIPFIGRSLFKWLRHSNWKARLAKEFKQHLDFDIPASKIAHALHHQSHAASAFFPSPFEDAAILIIDGVGEFSTTTIWHGQGNCLVKKANLNFPHSLGLLYSAFTYYTGFKVNSGEYKLMGLAPYGEPTFTETIKRHLITIHPDGTFQLNMRYFDFAVGESMTNDRFHGLFGGPPRESESRITQREMDLARSIQDVTEEIMLLLAKRAKELTNSKNLCLAGGVALNCVGNGKILQSNLFQKLWIQPAAGDAGGSLGAALNYYHIDLRQPRFVSETDLMKGCYLGPNTDEIETLAALSSFNAKYKKYESEEVLLKEVATMLADGKIVGWHQGRMEFGPRALGARSIIGDARSEKMQAVMNLKIKFRESFRPFAPSILADRVSEYFELNCASPYMLLVAPVHASKRREMSETEQSLFGIEKLNVKRSSIPAVTHVDYSARVQTVHRNTNKRFYDLLSEFERKTGCPVLVNTSFNVRGEPIVCTTKDSYRCFMRTKIDVLVVGNFVMLKDDQPKWSENTDWKQEFLLD